MKTQQHIHFIGICGVAMSALAVAFHKNGWQVTGSDKGFYPPISTHLNNAGISYYPGWHVDKMTKAGNPDLVIVGNVAGSHNAEWLYVQKQHLTYMSYPEAIATYFIKDKSIVCAGTYGKTTTSTLLSWICTDNKLDPSYMFGGLAWDCFDSAHIGTGKYCILEGDEYKTARWDNRPKFKLYKPTHLLLTAVSWDHADLYPTEESYSKEFQDLIHMIPEEGVIVANTDHPGVNNILRTYSSTNILTYGSNDQEYHYHDLTQTKKGISFTITHKQKTYHIESAMLGTYMAENITGAFAMAHHIGIDTAAIIRSIKSFCGMKRRLEKRHEGTLTVFDDIAHSPEKAAATLANLRAVYTGTITAIFEPNTGNRKSASIPQYQKAFTNADEVIIPRLTQVKTNIDETDPAMDGKQLKNVIAQSHQNVHYIEDDNTLIHHITAHKKEGDVIVFLGSHGFRGMIEETIQQL